MLKYGLFIALMCTGGAAFAQGQAPAQAAPAPAPVMTPEQSGIQTAAMGFGQCVVTGAQGVAADVTPQAGATRILAGCANQRQQLDRAVEAYIGTLPEAEKAAARAQYQSQMADAETRIAARITQMRAAPATPAAQ